MTPHEELLVAVGALLEYRSGPEGRRTFVREPLYNVALSYHRYLKSLPESRFKERALAKYERFFKPEEERLHQMYYSNVA